MKWDRKCIATLSREFSGSLLFVLMIVAGIAPVARGQGMMGMLPNPISSEDLNRYAERLALSRAQWPTFESAHDTYKSQYRDLQAGPAAELIQQYTTLAENSGIESIQKLLDRQQEIHEAVAVLDRRFFDEFQVVLSDSQLPSLVRVRRLRERQRYMGQQSMMMTGRPISDVSELFMALELPAPERALADPLVEQYERRFTSELRELHAKSTDAMRDMYGVRNQFEDIDIDAAGEATDELSEEELATQQEEMRWRMQEAYETAMADMFEKAAEIADLNRVTVRHVAQVLSPERGRSFRFQFLRAEHTELSYSILNAHIWSSSLGGLEEVDAETLDAVDAVAENYAIRADPVIEQFATIMDELNEGRSPFSMSGERDPELIERHSEIQQRLSQLNQESIESLSELLGKTRTERLLAATDENASWMIASLRDAEEAEAAARIEEDAEDEMWSRDPYVPARMGRSRLVDLAHELGLDETQQIVLDTLYDDYAVRYREIRQRDIEAISQLSESLWQYDPKTDSMTSADLRIIPRISVGRRKALGVLIEAEGEFFGQLEIIFATDEDPPIAIRRFREQRLRECYRATEMHQSGIGFGSSADATIDLLTLLGDHDDLGLTADQTAEMFGEYASTCFGLLRTQYECALACSEAQMRVMIEYENMTSESGEPADYRSVYQKFIVKPLEALRVATESIAELNRSTMDRLEAGLDASTFESVQVAYRRIAHPDIYADPQAAHNSFVAALGLEDLSDEYRFELAEAAAEYREQYDDASVRMIELQEESGTNDLWSMGMSEDPEEQQEQMKRYFELQQNIGRLRFDRSELNSRALRKLRTLLSDPQIRLIGGLPEPSDDSRGPFGW